MRRLALLVLIGGCGRVAFDRRVDTGPDATRLTRCLDARFNDATSGGWTVLDGTWMLAPDAGPDGSTAFGAQGALDSTIVHPALRNLTATRLSLDWLTEEPGAGDFVVSCSTSDGRRGPSRGTRSPCTRRATTARPIGSAITRLLVHRDPPGDHVDILAPTQPLHLAHPEPCFASEACGGVPLFTFRACRRPARDHEQAGGRRELQLHRVE